MILYHRPWNQQFGTLNPDGWKMNPGLFWKEVFGSNERLSGFPSFEACQVAPCGCEPMAWGNLRRSSWGADGFSDCMKCNALIFTAGTLLQVVVFGLWVKRVPSNTGPKRVFGALRDDETLAPNGILMCRYQMFKWCFRISSKDSNVRRCDAMHWIVSMTCKPNVRMTSKWYRCPWMACSPIYWNHSNGRLQLAVKLRQTTNPAFNFPVEGKSGWVGAQFLESFWLRQVSSDVGRMVIRAPGFLHPFLEESCWRLHMKARADRVRKTLFGGTQHPFVKISLRCFITCKKWTWTCVDRYRVMIMLYLQVYNHVQSMHPCLGASLACRQRDRPTIARCQNLCGFLEGEGLKPQRLHSPIGKFCGRKSALFGRFLRDRCWIVWGSRASTNDI